MTELEAAEAARAHVALASVVTGPLIALEPVKVAEAIARIEEARDTHVVWAEWQAATPDWRDHVTPDAPGDAEHHRRWVAYYDGVLEVLRAAMCCVEEGRA